jgi:hypothetical protein
LPAYIDSLKKKIDRLSLTPFGFCILLFLICWLAFGWFLPWLGLYWDDWPVIYIAHHGDPSVFWEFFSFDRPISAWTYVITYPVLGTNPLVWQIFTLSLRFLTALALWLALSELWPQRKYTTTAVAVLFAVYPTFRQQFISVAYSQHFITYALFFASVGLMLRAQREKRYWIWTGLALACEAVHLATMEYFTGLEFTRPILLYMLFRGHGLSVKSARVTALKRSAPYLLIMAVFLFWRFSFLNIPQNPNHPSLIGDLRIEPFSTLVILTERVLQDFIHILVGPWNDTFNPGLVDFSDASLVFSILIALVVCILLTLFLRRQARTSAGADEGEKIQWGAQALWLGLVAILFGMLPIRLAERDVLTGLFSDRFTLPALFGAALTWVGLARLTLRRYFHRALLIGILAGLSVGQQIRTANDYRWDWQEQTANYWQLYWRAPHIEENTALVFNGAFSVYVSEYAAAFAVNTLYNATDRNGQLPYWVLDYYDDVLSSGADEERFSKELRNFNFVADRKDSLYFLGSGSGRCLWLLTAQDEHNLDVPIEMRSVAGLSALSRIQTQNAQLPSPQIFGPEPAKGWCYYFQKIGLANQSEDWPMAVSLWHEAHAQRLRPNNQFEMIPVIFALGEQGDWQEASQLSLDALRKQANTQESLCALWDTWPEDRMETQEALGCD